MIRSCCLRETTGPRSVWASSGSPILIVLARSIMRSTNWSWSESGRSRRVPDSLDELVVERVGQEQAGARLAHLAGVHAEGEQRPVDRGLDVGIVEHDV